MVIRDQLDTGAAGIRYARVPRPNACADDTGRDGELASQVSHVGATSSAAHDVAIQETLRCSFFNVCSVGTTSTHVCLVGPSPHGRSNAITYFL